MASTLALILGLATCSDAESEFCEAGQIICPPDSFCTSDGTGCTKTKCGNNVTEGDEDCDDGNIRAGDGCSELCKNETCGDGKRGIDEQCDFAVDARCSMRCEWEECGDGYRDSDEKCDDGNHDNGDGCSADCQSNESCGNDHIDNLFGVGDPRNEVCDEGTVEDTETCGAHCHSMMECGDGVRTDNEECDEGPMDTEDCTSACKRSYCGDGHLNERTEDCDFLLDRAGCNADCTKSTCGDGKVNPYSEECDDADERSSPPCLDCRFSFCGDDRVDSMRGEQCDPPGRGDCTPSCKTAKPDDGVLTGNEECDDGNRNDDDYCVAGKLAVCGDGHVRTKPADGQPFEECDEGIDDTVGCNGARAQETARCRQPRCGDGYINAVAGEQCEPDSGEDSATCNGTRAPVALRCQPAVCGDGYVNREAGEGCDSGPGAVSCTSC